MLEDSRVPVEDARAIEYNVSYVAFLIEETWLTDDSTPDADSSFELVHPEKLLEVSQETQEVLSLK